LVVAARNSVHYWKGGIVSQRAEGLKLAGQRRLGRLQLAGQEQHRCLQLAGQEQLGRLLTVYGASLWPLVGRIPRVVPAKLVLGHADCREILDRHDVFRVPYLSRMKRVSGPFILGWDPAGTPRYEIERGWLDTAMRRDDIERLAERARALAERRVAEGRRRGGLDVVADLVDPVIDDAIGAWFGVPAHPPAPRLDWARAAFYGVFLNFAAVPVVTAQAQAGARALSEQVSAAADAGAPGDADVLSRLLASADAARELDRDAAVRNLVGLITAWVPQVSRVLPLALDALFHRQRELREAQQAARDGDVARVGDYVWEAARFRCTNPLLPRRSAAAHTLPSGKPVPAGAIVFAMLQSAMMDPDVLHEPRRFVAGRPTDVYLHFGGGLHRCFGEHAARVQLGQAAMALLACEGLRRAGRVRWKGPYPVGLKVGL
jgi:cytochrome P450